MAAAAKRQVIVGSTNRHKVREILELLQAAAARLGWECRGIQPHEIIDVAETGATFEANATLKAQALARHTRQWVLADDSGLSVDALQGAPGVHSARYAGEPCDEIGRAHV